jgi:hypothetical protein
VTFNGKEIGAGLLKHVLTGGGVTVGVLLAYAGYEIAKAQPQMVIELMRSWGAPAMLGAMAVVFMDRRIGQGMRLLSDNTRATQKMADAMSEIAHKDDNRARETGIDDGDAGQTARRDARRDQRASRT